MSKALIIKGVDYSVNSFDTVNIDGSDTKPCTGISLSANSISLNQSETSTLVATVTPYNTTDRIIWTSSDPTVATVSNGVVTALALGFSTVTATCGTNSATCVVSVSYVLTDVVKTQGKRLAGSNIFTGNGTVYFEDHVNYGAIYADTGTLPLYKEPTQFPIPIPNNATKLKITVPEGITVYRVAMIDATKAPPIASGSCTLLAFVAGSEMTLVSSGTYEYALPTYDGYTLDSVVFCFGKTNFALTDFDGITVEFLAA